MSPSICVNTQWQWDGKCRLSSEWIVVWSERWNGSPLLIKHKSILIVDDKQQRRRI
jgi:hypothetical protein